MCFFCKETLDICYFTAFLSAPVKLEFMIHLTKNTVNGCSPVHRHTGAEPSTRLQMRNEKAVF